MARLFSDRGTTAGRPSLLKALERVATRPGPQAVLLYRLSRRLWLRRLEFPSELLWRVNYFLTGADIHPGAEIGGGLRLTHTAGVVIGKGVRIGSNVTLLHGVTLGGSAKGWFDGTFADGFPEIGDDTEIMAGAKAGASSGRTPCWPGTSPTARPTRPAGRTGSSGSRSSSSSSAWKPWNGNSPRPATPPPRASRTGRICPRREREAPPRRTMRSARPELKPGNRGGRDAVGCRCVLPGRGGLRRTGGRPQDRARAPGSDRRPHADPATGVRGKSALGLGHLLYRRRRATSSA